MKKMFTILAVLFVAFAINTSAQSKMHLGIGPFVGLPMGTFGDITELGYGGAVQGELAMGDNLNGTLTTGYLMFGGKSQTIGGFTFDYGDWSVIPVLVGSKYYFDKGIYGMVQAGLNFLSYTNKIPNPFTGGTIEVSASDTKFGYGVGLGYEIPMGASGALDLFVKFGSLASDANFIGLTALYKFGI